MSAISIIIMIAAIVAGYFFIKKFSSIERYLFGSNDADSEESSSGVIFLFASTAIGALATAWGDHRRNFQSYLQYRRHHLHWCISRNTCNFRFIGILGIP